MLALYADKEELSFGLQGFC